MFDLGDMLSPLDPGTIAVVIILGLAMGLAMRASDHVVSQTHLYWMLAGGLVFFLPIAIAHFYHGLPVWERLVGDFFLWAFYVLGMYAGSHFRLERSSLGRRPSIRARRRRGRSPGSGQPPDAKTVPARRR